MKLSQVFSRMWVNGEKLEDTFVDISNSLIKKYSVWKVAYVQCVKLEVCLSLKLYLKFLEFCNLCYAVVSTTSTLWSKSNILSSC